MLPPRRSSAATWARGPTLLVENRAEPKRARKPPAAAPVRYSDEHCGIGRATATCRRALRLDDAVADGDGDGARTVAGAELARRGGEVLLDRALRDAEDLARLPGRLALRRPGQHLALARRYARHLVRRREQAAHALEAVHRHQVQRRLAALVEVEMRAADRDAGIVRAVAVHRHDEAARHMEISGAIHHFGRARLVVGVERRLAPFERVERAAALPGHRIDADIVVGGVKVEPLDRPALGQHHLLEALLRMRQTGDNEGTE